MTPRHAGLALLVSTACAVTLETPADARIRCVDDDDCPSERCSTAVGVCIAADDDDSPLVVASVEAIDSRHIVVTFSRAVEPVSASDYTRYALNGGLSPESAVVADDNLSVTVQTSLQRLRTYQIDVLDVVDPIGRPLQRSPRQFAGIGEPVSGQSPTPLSPADRSLFTDPVITLTWAVLPDAVTYTVEVARLGGAGDETPIPGSPFTTQETELTVEVAEDATFVWRVRADISREPPVVSAFAVFGAAIHVYCPAAADCTALDSWDAGTSVRPSRRIGRAIALASFLGRDEIRVAGRGAGAVYEEGFVIAPPVRRVRGGYDPTFTVADAASAPTVVRGDPTAVRIVTPDDVELAGLELRASGAAALALTGVGNVVGTGVTLSASDGARPLDVRRCGDDTVVSFTGLRTSGFGATAPAPVRVTGGCTAVFDAAEIGGAGIVVTSATVSLSTSRLVATQGVSYIGEQGYEGLHIVAVRIDGGSLAVSRSVVRAGEDGDSGAHIALEVRRGEVRVDASQLIAGEVGFAECFPRNCQGIGSALAVGPLPDTGIDVTVTNSVLVAAAPQIVNDDIAAAVRYSGSGRLTLIHDALFARDGTALYNDGQNALGDDLQALDTAFVCSGTGIGIDNVSTSDPRLLRASAIVGCSVPYRRMGTAYTTGDAIEGITSGPPHTYSNVSVFAAPIASTFPAYAGADAVPGTEDDDWSCGPACATSGEPSTTPICGANGGLVCAASVTSDSSGTARTTPVSIGPREVD